MKRIRVLVPIWVVLLTGMGMVDCDCGGETIHPVCPEHLKCQTTEECEEGVACTDGCCGGMRECEEIGAECPNDKCCSEDYFCTADCGATCDPDKVCSSSNDCADLGNCYECIGNCCESFACTSDADCPPDGDLQRYCSEEPDPDLGCRVCEYVRCASDDECTDPTFPLYIEECPAGRFPKCRNGLCECAHPCGGECPDGQFCCESSRTCQTIPDPCPGVNCPPCEAVNPDPGGTLDVQACEYVGADCTCMPLPPLQDAFAGQHSAIALGADGIPVLSGYFGQPYGDLIFGVASAAQAGATVAWSFVDGVPADAPCEGAADGPRGGIAEPGDDVGWDTDIVVDLNGLPRISYFDRTNGDLKYAAYDGAAWNIHVVDADGVTGRFTSLILDFADRPAIAYMTTRENMTSYLKVARATGTNPASAADWTIYIVDAAPVPCLPSECGAGEACLEATGTCEVLDDPANCGGGCPSGEVCIAANCEVEATQSSLEDLPDGVGLFANLDIYADNSPAVGYYDSTYGNLKFAWWEAGPADFSPPVILAGESGGIDLGDLGADVDMFISHPDDTVHLAYQDADLGDLYYMSFPGHQTGSAVVELVDLGARDANGDPTDEANAVGGLHWVGNFASTLVDDSGTVRIAYQDGTSLDLVHAIRGGGGWTIQILAKRQSGDAFDGNFGFFVDQVLNQARDLAFISNFKHNLRTDPWSSAIDIRSR